MNSAAEHGKPNGAALASRADLPEAVTRRGITEAQWRTLANNLFPGANPTSVLMVWDYCIARRLDPLKKPCHIVPMEVKDAKTGEYSWRDVVMPGIYEHRTTAQRTGHYLGHARAEYGPTVEAFGVAAPEWCDFTVYRWNAVAGVRAEFPVRVLFVESVAVTRDRKTQEFKANARWSKAPFQMLTKCAEAAALREAFPDELGGEQTFEEMDGQRAAELPPIDVAAKPVPPEGFQQFADDLLALAEQGMDALEAEFAKPEVAPLRNHMTAAEPALWESLKKKATEADAQRAANA